jgi:hypothetical protein
MFDYRIEDYNRIVKFLLEGTARTNGKVFGFIIPCIEQMKVGVIIRMLQR